jgi:cytochrome P450
MLVWERLVALAVLLAVAWPLGRVVVLPSFRMALMRETPFLAGVLVAYLATVAAIAAVAPWLLTVLAIPAALWLFAIALHGRVARGRRRGWPPGRLTLPSFAIWLQRDFLRDQHRRFGSIFKTNQVVRPTACLVGLGGSLDFMRTHEDALSSPTLWFARFVPGGLFRHIDTDRHDAYRDIFRAAFSREVFLPFASAMRARMRHELVCMAADSARDPAHGIAPRPYLQRLMFALWAELFFDVGEAHPDFARLKALFHVIDLRNPSRASDRHIRAALAEIAEIVDRAAATTSAPRGLAATIARRHPEMRADSGVMGNLIYEMHITWADLAGLLQWLLRMLTDHPYWLERLHAAPAADADEGEHAALAARIVSETLRMQQVEHLYRTAERDIEHEGKVIPRGWMVRICLQESHRDPAVFANPDAFDPDRFVGRTYTRREFLPFGAGRHACIGESLARTVGRLFVDELGSGWEWRTVADGPIEQGSWRHWRPSSRWRIAMAATTRSGSAGISSSHTPTAE